MMPTARGADVASLKRSALRMAGRSRCVREPLAAIELTLGDGFIPTHKALAPRFRSPEERDLCLLGLTAVQNYSAAIGARWDAARVRDTIFAVQLGATR